MQNRKKCIFKYYLCYYKYKELFLYNHLEVNLLILIKSQQFTYYNSQIVNNSELERYNKDFQKKELLLLDSKKLNNQNRKKIII